MIYIKNIIIIFLYLIKDKDFENTALTIFISAIGSIFLTVICFVSVTGCLVSPFHLGSSNEEPKNPIIRNSKNDDDF